MRACTSRSQARRVRSPCVFSSANCAASLASAREPMQASAPSRAHATASTRGAQELGTLVLAAGCAVVLHAKTGRTNKELAGGGEQLGASTGKHMKRSKP